MRRSIKIRNTTILSIAIFLLAFIQVLSYVNSDWVSRISGIRTILSQAPVQTTWMVIIRHIAFWIIIFSCLKFCSFHRVIIIPSQIFLIIIVFYTFDAIQRHGLMESLYLSDLPIMYLFIIGCSAGKNEKVWDETVKIVRLLLLIYLVMFVYEFVTTYLAFGWSLYSGSSMTAFYSQLFWVSTVFLVVSLEKSKDAGSRLSIWVYALLIFLLIGAVVIRSRSWIIQSILLLLVTLITNSRNRESGLGRLKFVIGFLVLIALSVLIISNLFPLFAEAIIKKGTTDTRSFQYQEIFEQTSLVQWLTGQGIDATYDSALYGKYSYIDNDFLYIAFHYGIIVAVLYFAPYLKTFYYCIRKKRELGSCSLLYAGVVLMWVLSVNGLSIFNRVHLDVKSILMPLLVGHVNWKIYGGKNYENTFFSR